MKRAGLFGLLLALEACGNQTPTATVSASEAALTAAGQAIMACYAVPACLAVAPKPAIKTAYDNAYGAVTAAQATADAGGTPDMTATTAAMSALSTLITGLPAAAAAPVAATPAPTT